MEWHLIVNRLLKEKIDHSLNEREKRYFQICLQAKEDPLFPPLHLERWNGDLDALQKVLLERGRQRLLFALSDADPLLTLFLPKAFQPTQQTVPEKLLNRIKKQVKQTITYIATFGEDHVFPPKIRENLPVN